MAEGTSTPNAPASSNNEAIRGHEGILKALIDKAPALIGDIMDSMLGVVESLKKVRNVTAHETCSPSVSMRLTELQRARFTEVTDAGENAKKEIKEAGKHFQPKRDKALVAQKRKVMATNFMGSAAAFCAKSGAILTCFSPPAGIATIMAGILGGLATESLGIDAEFSENQIKIYTNACDSVMKLNYSLCDAMIIVDDMHHQINCIKGCGIRNETKKKRYNTRKSKKEVEEIKSAAERLCFHLRELKEKMGTMCESSTKLIEKLDQL